MEDLPPEPPVAQQRRDVGMAGEAPEAVILPEENRNFGANRAIGAIGIFGEVRIARA